MKRLTTDTPKGNFETMLNFVYGKDGWAHIRHDGEREDVPLTDWAKAQCIKRGCDEFPGETTQEIDETLCDCLMDGEGCPVALAYCFACQASHLRGYLAAYEDTRLTPEDIDALQKGRLVIESSNPPLTLDELREMGKEPEPIYITGLGWKICYGIEDRFGRPALKVGVTARIYLDNYGEGFVAYRRKPEDGPA